MTLRNDFDQLVDVKNGFISREIFVDAESLQAKSSTRFSRGPGCSSATKA